LRASRCPGIRQRRDECRGWRGLQVKASVDGDEESVGSGGASAFRRGAVISPARGGEHVGIGRGVSLRGDPACVVIAS
jgi:hypothetical protein